MQQKINELLLSMYEEYQATLRVLAKSYGIPDKDIDDIVQETFISYFGHYSLEWTLDRKKAMLVRILKNRCVDYHRKQRKVNTISIDSEKFIEDCRMSEQYYAESSFNQIFENETLKEVYKVIAKMSKDLQEAAILHLIEGRPQKEVCEILGISSDACRARISRARKFLRRELRKENMDH